MDVKKFIQNYIAKLVVYRYEIIKLGNLCLKFIYYKEDTGFG